MVQKNNVASGLKPEVRAGLISGGVVLGLAFVVFVLFELLGRGEGLGDLAFMALIILPLIGYAAGAGMLEEFTAPGGWSAKFRKIAGAEVKSEASMKEAEVEFEGLQMVEKSSLQALKTRVDKLTADGNVALTLQMGRAGYFAPAVYRYLSALMARDADMSVVFVDGQGRFVASTSGAKLMAALSLVTDQDAGSNDLSHEVISAIANDDLDQLADLVSVTRTALPEGSTNSEALKKLLEADVPAMVLVSSDQMPKGIVRRDDIVARMLNELVAD